jgi:hypothetical protein
LTKLQHILSFTRKNAGISENSADAKVQPQNIPDSPDISLNDVPYFHDCAHGVYAADKNVTGFDVSWIPHDGAMDSSDASNVHHGLEATTYTFGWAKIPQELAKLGGCQCNHRTEYSLMPDISLNDVSFTSMTVHMETVYAG